MEYDEFPVVDYSGTNPDDAHPLQFVECSNCRSKLGMPILCDSCLHNRQAISTLRDKVELERDIRNVFLASRQQWRFLAVLFMVLWLVMIIVVSWGHG